LWEGFGLILLEAMAASLPIVASGISAIPEVLDESCATLVKPKNVAQLSTALKSLISDKARQKEMGKAGRKRVETEFSIEKMIDETIKIYEALLP
jgi:glycosyltransferase involved in cell wall biosynthesis